MCIALPLLVSLVLSCMIPAHAQHTGNNKFKSSDVPVTVVTQVGREAVQVGNQVNITAKRNADNSIVVQRIDIMNPSPK